MGGGRERRAGSQQHLPVFFFFSFSLSFFLRCLLADFPVAADENFWALSSCWQPPVSQLTHSGFRLLSKSRHAKLYSQPALTPLWTRWLVPGQNATTVLAVAFDGAALLPVVSSWQICTAESRGRLSLVGFLLKKNYLTLATLLAGVVYTEVHPVPQQHKLYVWNIGEHCCSRFDIFRLRFSCSFSRVTFLSLLISCKCEHQSSGEQTTGTFKV